MKKKIWTLRVWRKEFLKRRIEMSIVLPYLTVPYFKDFTLLISALVLLELKNVLRELRGVLQFIHIR